MKTLSLAASLALVLVASGTCVTVTAAQQTQLEVLVEQIAGNSIYLRAGTTDGISVDDTLTVYDPETNRRIGSLLVTGATSSRAVVSFLADPFPLTRGTVLSIQIGSSPELEERVEEPAARTAQSDPVESAPTSYPSASGRLYLQFNTLGSTTSWASNEDVSIARRFTTPSLGLRLRVKDLPGGFEFTSNVRGAYRHSTNDVVDPAHSMRVYQASFHKSFERVPVQVQFGRFYSRYEVYSGYWDGVLLRYGSKGFGAGVLAGFEPRRANEGISTDIPKYTAFVDFSHNGERVGYFSDLSVHRRNPGDGLLTETSLGWSQRLTVGRSRLGTDLQVHRDPDGNTLSLTRLHTNGSVPLTRRVSLLGRYAFDRPNYRFSSPQLFSYERWQAGLGIRYWDRGGSASVHVMTNRVNQGDYSYSVSSHFRVSRTRIMELGFHGAGTIWLLEDTRVVDLLAGIDRDIGRVQARASYRLYETVGTTSTFLTHTVDAGLVFPLGNRMFSTINARLQQGQNLSANSIFVNIWTSF